MDKRTKIRLSLGEAWMMCQDCGAKLYSFDGNKDASIPCPHKEKCKAESDMHKQRRN